VCNDAVLSVDIMCGIEGGRKLLMNGEFESILKTPVITDFKVLLRNSFGETRQLTK
jgi:hypothetical protein